MSNVGCLFVSCYSLSGNSSISPSCIFVRPMFIRLTPPLRGCFPFPYPQKRGYFKKMKMEKTMIFLLETVKQCVKRPKMFSFTLRFLRIHVGMAESLSYNSRYSTRLEQFTQNSQIFSIFIFLLLSACVINSVYPVMIRAIYYK